MWNVTSRILRARLREQTLGRMGKDWEGNGWTATLRPVSVHFTSHTGARRMAVSGQSLGSLRRVTSQEQNAVAHIHNLQLGCGWGLVFQRQCSWQCRRLDLLNDGTEARSKAWSQQFAPRPCSPFWPCSFLVSTQNSPGSPWTQQIKQFLL